MKTLRNNKGITQVELAELIRQPDGTKGVDDSYISDAERGKRIPGWLAKEIARVLGVSVRKLFKKVQEREWYEVK